MGCAKEDLCSVCLTILASNAPAKNAPRAVVVVLLLLEEAIPTMMDTFAFFAYLLARSEQVRSSTIIQAT
jgi:hypothetical protein